MDERAALSLLGDVVEQVGCAHAPAAIALGLARALGASWPVRRVELALRDGDRVEALGCGPLDGAAARLEGPLSRSVLAGAPTRPWLWAAAAGPRPASELERAAQAGAPLALVLPLGEQGGAAVIALTERPGGDIEGALGAALGRVVAVALGNARLVARVAAVSRRAYAENRELRDELQRLASPPVAVSASMRALLFEAVPLVARQDTTVLIRGESGTGKEVVARHLHALSPRASRPFLKVNCGALPEALIESTLFGHEKGAFTGAVARHAGLFERADGGTLLLDEVAELPPLAQVKLLRVLQEGEFERVGGEVPVRVRVRVVAATHRDLEAMVARGAFRADLYYRLNVFPLWLPPLRQRPDDVAALAEALLARLAARFDRPPPRLTPAALSRLVAHSWPGNVRELENVLERSLVLSLADDLRLPDDFDAPSPLAPPPAPAPLASAPETSTYRASLVRCIEEALTRSGGRIYGPGGAAEALAMKPTTLQSTMARLGIRRAKFVRS